MMHDFILLPDYKTPEKTDGKDGLCSVFNSGRYSLLTGGAGVEVYGETAVYINGYVMPVNSCFERFRDYSQHRLIASLHKEYCNDFVRYVKGIFLIIIFEKDNITVITDQTGLFRAFYTITQNGLYLSGSVTLLKEAGVSCVFDRVSVQMQMLFHRVPSCFTLFRDVFKTVYGTKITIKEGKTVVSSYWDPDMLLQKTETDPSPGFEIFADTLRRSISNFNEYLKLSAGFITLTGGKDSRTILAALLNAGISPVGFTYGNRESRDAVYADKLAHVAGTIHFVINPPSDKQWFEEMAEKITGFGNPEISLHRSHRLYAFSNLAGKSIAETAVYSGYLGGELLMGIYKDDLIFTPFLTRFWETGETARAEEWLEEYFYKNDASDSAELKERISGMRCMNNKYSNTLKAFYSIFEIGVPHHSQDVNLSGRYFNYPFPAFLDTDFLELLFKSRFSMLKTGDPRFNPLKRYKLYELNLNVQHILCPEIDKVPFGKKGSYNTREFLRGPLYWSVVKTLRFFTERRKYPPSFVYGPVYKEYLIENIKKINNDKQSDVNSLINTDNALNSLLKTENLSSEKSCHRYSNIIAFYLIEKALANENQSSNIQK